MTEPNNLAPVYESVAATLRHLAATGEPLHPTVLSALAQEYLDLAHNARTDELNVGDWAGFDEPGNARQAHDLAVLIGEHHP